MLTPMNNVTCAVMTIIHPVIFSQMQLVESTAPGRDTRKVRKTKAALAITPRTKSAHAIAWPVRGFSPVRGVCIRSIFAATLVAVGAIFIEASVMKAVPISKPPEATKRKSKIKNESMILSTMMGGRRYLTASRWGSGKCTLSKVD